MSAVANSFQIFATPATLATFDATRIVDGAIARCRVVNDSYAYLRNPSAGVLAAADAVNIVAATTPAGAVWIRLYDRNLPAEYEAAWFLDTAGSDANDGITALTPLKTVAELANRLRGATLRQNVTVTLTAGSFAADPVNFDLDCGSFSILFLGNVTSSAGDIIVAPLPTVVGAAGTNAGAQRYTLTATALAFTDKQRIRCTASSVGATGNWTWVTNVTVAGVGGTANTARWGSLADPRVNTTLGALTEPVAGDTYVQDTLNTTLGRLNLRAHGRGRIIIQDCILTVNVSGDAYSMAGDNSNANGVMCYGCKFNDTTTLIASPAGSGWTAVGCQFASTTTVFLQGTHVPRNCVFTGTVQTATVGCLVNQNNSCCFDGAFLQLIDGEWDYGSGAPNNDIQWVDGTTANGLEINPGASLQGHGGTTNAWGLNNAYTGVFARLFAFSVWTYATKPSVPGGTGNDANVGGTVKLWAAIPFQQVEGNGGSAAIITL